MNPQYWDWRAVSRKTNRKQGYVEGKSAPLGAGCRAAILGLDKELTFSFSLVTECTKNEKQEK
jgi:hypothetical protein